MSRFLITTWDGAGNLAPTLGIARTLVARGHDVRLMGHRTIAERGGDVGTRFIPLSQAELWDAMDDPGDFAAEIRLLIDELSFSSTIANDLATELDREPADAVLVDCMLFTAIDVALASSGGRTATLFHAPYTVFRGGPLVEMLAPGMAIANARRGELGLPPIDRLGDIHDACACAIVAAPKEFEPDVPDATNVLRIGPVLDAPPLCCEVDEVDVPAGSTPLVLVSLSTSQQGQADLLQRCVDAVAQLPVNAIVTTGPSIDPASVTAGDNTQVVRYVPHSQILPSGGTGDHPRGPGHHDGRARPWCATAVHADRP
jgi:UDP:flavonoid glycosyltransferase YjiC (YdhE family)